MDNFGQLISNEIPRLRRYARALKRNPDTADDLVQETILRALGKGHLWQPGTNLRTWLFTIMHNQYINDVRRSVRENTVGLDENALWHPATQSASLELRDMDRALGRLPIEQRSVVLLVGLEGMRYEEVAKVLDVPVGTVRSRLSRARDTLRTLLNDPPPRAKAANGSRAVPYLRPVKSTQTGVDRAEATGED